tara:strand:- start:92 stop:334 length:243 start_codon:yes stop_codon:yes gene_type:complete
MPVAALPWDEIRSRRGRSSGVVVHRKGRWTTTAYDKFIVDDIMRTLAHAEVVKQVTGKGNVPKVPKRMKDYLLKQDRSMD